MISHGSEGTQFYINHIYLLHIKVISHGSEGIFSRSILPFELHIKVISHGSEGCTGCSDPLGRLYISVIPHGSEGMDIRSAVQIWGIEKEGYFVKWTDCSNFMVWLIDFI